MEQFKQLFYETSVFVRASGPKSRLPYGFVQIPDHFALLVVDTRLEKSLSLLLKFQNSGRLKVSGRLLHAPQFCPQLLQRIPFLLQTCSLLVQEIVSIAGRN